MKDRWSVFRSTVPNGGGSMVLLEIIGLITLVAVSFIIAVFASIAVFKTKSTIIRLASVLVIFSITNSLGDTGTWRYLYLIVVDTASVILFFRITKMLETRSRHPRVEDHATADDENVTSISRKIN